MTAGELQLIREYLSRVHVRGFEDEETLVKLIKKIDAQIMRTNKSKNGYTSKSGKAA